MTPYPNSVINDKNMRACTGQSCLNQPGLNDYHNNNANAPHHNNNNNAKAPPGRQCLITQNKHIIIMTMQENI